ncbi:MAG: hypothetical protein GX838_00765 [Clostridiaceae bacterium]|nr:hypothetical protein [Clostridiaceae bacterium]
MKPVSKDGENRAMDKGVTDMVTKKINIRAAILVGLLTALFNFAVFYVGVGIFLKTPLLLTNYLAMAVLSLAIGVFSFIFMLFRMFYAAGLFTAGLLVGSAFMLSTFWKGVAGWEDLIGLLSFFVFLAIGLAAGLLVQLIVFLVNKSRKV